MNLGLVRRGFSPSGGAEAYLRRLARSVGAAGHEVTLFTSAEWPESEWPSGKIVRIASASPIAFADELARIDPWKHAEVVVSLERIWRCDFFRAGDGVHRAWLERRKKYRSVLEKISRTLNRKHEEILRLENALLGERGAARVIINSSMVHDEIVQFYNYPSAQIDLVRNGIRTSDFGPAPMKRAAAREQLNLAPDTIAVLFVGSGWERKGLRFAIAALEQVDDPRLILLVAGRGNERRYRSRIVRFLGEMNDVRLPLAASDIFILPTIYDPFSNASLEALAAGLPVITTRANGCSEIIQQNEHGTVVDEADDVNALAKALRFWSDEKRRRDALPALLERASQFDIARNVAEMLELLEAGYKNSP